MSQVAMRFFGALVLMALTVVLVGCREPDTFFSTNVSLAQSDQHRRAQKGELTTSELADSYFLLSGHRIIQGTGTVLGVRHYSEGEALDSGKFRKLTIFVADRDDDRVVFELPEAQSQVLAYLSEGSAEFPRNGCYGYARSGSIEVRQSGRNAIELKVNLDFDMEPAIPERNTWCKSERVHETISLEKIDVDNLTPWLGGPSEKLRDQSHP